MDAISYSLDTQQFARYRDFSITHSTIISGVGTGDNIAVLIGDNGSIESFPSTESITDGYIVTKEIVMLGRVLRRVALFFEGDSAIVTAICKNRRFESDLEISITVTESGRFYGLPNGAKCDSVLFKIEGAKRIESIRYTVV